MTFGIGINDFNIEEQHIKNISNFINKKLLYATLQHSWIDENSTLQLYKNQIEILLQQNLQPILIWDPVLPRMFSDSLYAISLGLHDNYIKSYFQILKEIQNQNQNFIPIIWCGSRLNAQQTFTSNSTLFKQIFIRIRQICEQMNVNAKFAVSYDTSYCDCLGDQQNQTQQCQDGLIWSDEKQSYVKCQQDQFNFNYQINCRKDPIDIYPGDSFVDWIIIQMQNQDTFDDMQTQISKMQHLVNIVSMSKPVMLLIGCRSQGGNKSVYISQIPQIQNSNVAKNIKCILLEMKESNQDIALYDSINGDIKSSISNNGKQLYSYSALQTVFQNFKNVLENIDLQIAASGSLCSVGQYGQLDIMNCKECPVGWYQNQTGQQNCIPCEIGYFQDNVGQQNCKKCGEQLTTLSEATTQLNFCICIENYYKLDEEKGICKPCKRNTFSRKGMDKCMSCPSDSQWKGSNGKAGEGCFCKHKYQWSSDQAQCIRQLSDSINDITIQQKIKIYTGLLAVLLLI